MGTATQQSGYRLFGWQATIPKKAIPLDCSLPTAEKIKIVSGSMTRIKQDVHMQQDQLRCLVDLRVETMTALYSKKVYRKAVGMQVLSASDCLNEKEKRSNDNKLTDD